MITGAFTLNLRLTEIGATVRGAARAGVVETAQHAVPRMQARAHVKTGAMRDSVAVSDVREDAGGVEVDVGAYASYSIYMEKGHRTKSGTFVGPFPFVQPGADETFSELSANIKAHMP